MFLTVSKRLEFSASRRLFVPGWTKAENLAAFGSETEAKHGTGRNYVAFFVFSGPVNPANGMLINISEMKDRAGGVVHDLFDHKFLNADNPAFSSSVPSPENVAAELFRRTAPRFTDVEAKLVACHLQETPERSATFYENGTVEGNHWFEFSAARCTMSPHLSRSENEKLFGNATSLHGHNYRARLTFPSARLEAEHPLVRNDRLQECIDSIRSEIDHRDLNNEVPGMKNRPATTESLAGYIYDRFNACLPIARVRLHERADFFAEYWAGESVFLGMELPFCAAHRLHAAKLSEAENQSLYGKCNNPGGHGHRYVPEATIGGDYDARSGTLYDFVLFRSALQEALADWSDRHLDLETKDFQGSPSTGENIVRKLWQKLDPKLNQQLVRLRLWETPNNRFTLRRT